MVRALAPHQSVPDSIPGTVRQRHMWVEFVVDSRPCSEGFSPVTPVFLSPQKNNISKFQFEQERRATPWVPLKFSFPSRRKAKSQRVLITESTVSKCILTTQSYVWNPEV